MERLVKNGPSTRNGVLPVTTLLFLKFLFQFMNLLLSVDFMYQWLKCPYSYFLWALEFYLTGALPQRVSLTWRIHWILSTILKSNESVWSAFWYIKVCKFWKCIYYTINYEKKNVTKNFFGQNKRYKNRTFSFRKLQFITVLHLYLRFLYELK